jgi:hypothetical protein
VLGALGDLLNNDVKVKLRPVGPRFNIDPDRFSQLDSRYCIRHGAKILYNDFPESEAILWESHQIPGSYKVQETSISRAACKYFSSTYLICEKDQVAPPILEEIFAGIAKADVLQCSTGHFPMLSQTAMLVKKIAAMSNKITEEYGALTRQSS